MNPGAKLPIWSVSVETNTVNPQNSDTRPVSQLHQTTTTQKDRAAERKKAPAGRQVQNGNSELCIPELFGATRLRSPKRHTKKEWFRLRLLADLLIMILSTASRTQRPVMLTANLRLTTPSSFCGFTRKLNPNQREGELSLRRWNSPAKSRSTRYSANANTDRGLPSRTPPMIGHFTDSNHGHRPLE